MTNKDILSHIDHTLLKAVSTWSEIKMLCEQAMEYGTASVCIPPSFVSRIKKEYPELTICTVIGFPLGYSTSDTKAFEAQDACNNGADEIDMVVNLGDVKDKAFKSVTDEISRIKKITGNRILKVIIETCYLTEDEKIRLCRSVTEAGADFIKTSTGFGTSGAKIEDVRLFKRNIGSDVKIKAAGGVKTREDLELFIDEGADRIGTSSAVKILAGEQVKGY